MQISTVKEQDHDIRLDRWFARYYPNISHTEIMKACRKKLIKVDNKKAEGNQRVLEGQTIKHPDFADAPAPQKAAPRPQDKSWLLDTVLFKNKHVIAINKPSGLATQGGTGQKNHLDRLLPFLQFDAATPPKLVHRLDKDTSGVLLIARTPKAAETLSKSFADKTAQKAYWALTVRAPIQQEGTINLPISKQKQAGYDGYERMIVDRREGKKAITDYQVIEKLAQRFCWIELYPRTGRTHQLRVHMEAMDTPIYGDIKYGGLDVFPEGINLPEKLHLHARRIIIPDLFGEMIDVSAPMPEHMQQSWKLLGLENPDK